MSSVTLARTTLTVEPFRPLGAADRLAVGEEADRLLAFLSPEAEARNVRFEGEFA